VNVETNTLRVYVLLCVCVLLLGAGIGIGWGIWGRPASGGSELDRQRDSLAGEFADEQRAVEERQRSLEAGIDRCLDIVDGAGGIIEQNDRELSSAIGNLGEAKRYIEKAIEERKSLKDSIDSLRANLLNLRGDNRVEDNEVAE
jgi:hypothetical protein